MILKVNGETVELKHERLTVAELIEIRQTRPGACAVEVNHRIAPRREWPSAELRDGDEVEIVTLVGGG